MKTTITISITCDNCGETHPLAITSELMRAIRLARPERAPRDTDADDQGLLFSIFRAMPFLDWFQSADVPESVFAHRFSGLNPRAQFGLWLAHQSRKKRGDGQWYVRRNKPDESAPQYLIAFKYTADCQPPKEYSERLEYFRKTGHRQ